MTSKVKGIELEKKNKLVEEVDENKIWLWLLLFFLVFVHPMTYIWVYLHSAG